MEVNIKNFFAYLLTNIKNTSKSQKVELIIFVELLVKKRLIDCGTDSQNTSMTACLHRRVPTERLDYLSQIEK